jgi:hypothetical protein
MCVCWSWRCSPIVGVAQGHRDRCDCDHTARSLIRHQGLARSCGSAPAARLIAKARGTPARSRLLSSELGDLLHPLANRPKARTASVHDRWGRDGLASARKPLATRVVMRRFTVGPPRCQPRWTRVAIVAEGPQISHVSVQGALKAHRAPRGAGPFSQQPLSLNARCMGTIC